jgi:hypothetical protein
MISTNTTKHAIIMLQKTKQIGNDFPLKHGSIVAFGTFQKMWKRSFYLLKLLTIHIQERKTITKVLLMHKNYNFQILDVLLDNSKNLYF